MDFVSTLRNRTYRRKSDWFRFWPKVHIAEKGCWDWLGQKGQKGYGRFETDVTNRSDVPRFRAAHRMAYAFLRGPIPEGLTIDHLCRNRSCVNPDHLEIVTAAENTMRGIGEGAKNKLKVFCSNGHEFTPENTKKIPSRPNARYCRPCCRMRDAERKARRRQGIPPLPLGRPKGTARVE